MHKEVDCPECDGVGIVEDRKGKEHTCPSCKGKGVLDGSKEEDTQERDSEDHV